MITEPLSSLRSAAGPAHDPYHIDAQYCGSLRLPDQLLKCTLLLGKKKGHARRRGQGSVGIGIQYTTATSVAFHAFVRLIKAGLMGGLVRPAH